LSIWGRERLELRVGGVWGPVWVEAILKQSIQTILCSGVTLGQSLGSLVTCSQLAAGPKWRPFVWSEFRSIALAW